MRSEAGAYLRSRRSISRNPVTLPMLARVLLCYAQVCDRLRRELLAHIQHFDRDNPAIGVEIENETGPHLFRLDDLVVSEANEERVRFGIISQLHVRCPPALRSKNIVIT